MPSPEFVIGIDTLVVEAQYGIVIAGAENARNGSRSMKATDEVAVPEPQSPKSVAVLAQSCPPLQPNWASNAFPRPVQLTTRAVSSIVTVLSASMSANSDTSPESHVIVWPTTAPARVDETYSSPGPSVSVATTFLMLPKPVLRTSSAQVTRSPTPPGGFAGAVTTVTAPGRISTDWESSA